RSRFDILNLSPEFSFAAQTFCRLQEKLLQHFIHQFLDMRAIRFRKVLHSLHTCADECSAFLPHLRAQRFHQPNQFDACLPGEELCYMLIHNALRLGHFAFTSAAIPLHDLAQVIRVIDVDVVKFRDIRRYIPRYAQVHQEQRAISPRRAARGNRALFLMDLGVPRNIAPDVAELYNVYVYNTDDLSEVVQRNRSARESEMPKAQGIVDEHVAKFLSWQASVELVGLMEALRTKMREERAAFIRARMETMKHLAETDRAHVEKLMDEMLEKLLLEPAERLRGERELRRKIQNVEALRDLFLSNREKP